METLICSVSGGVESLFFSICGCRKKFMANWQSNRFTFHPFSLHSSTYVSCTSITSRTTAENLFFIPFTTLELLLCKHVSFSSRLFLFFYFCCLSISPKNYSIALLTSGFSSNEMSLSLFSSSSCNLLFLLHIPSHSLSLSLSPYIYCGTVRGDKMTNKHT